MLAAATDATIIRAPTHLPTAGALHIAHLDDGCILASHRDVGLRAAAVKYLYAAMEQHDSRLHVYLQAMHEQAPADMILLQRLLHANNCSVAA